MKGHEAVARFLDAEGVGPLFTLLSEELMGFAGNLPESLPLVQARHEQAAVAMADGYSRATGDVGVALVGRGPAVAQTGTALTTAAKRGSDVLLLVADRPRDAYSDGLNKEFDQSDFLRTLLDSVFVADDDALLAPSFAEAFRLLRAGRGPVAVQLPWDLLDGDVDVAGWEDTTIGDERPDPNAVRPDSARVAAAVDAYAARDGDVPPVVLAGDGAKRADADDAIRRLVDRLDAALVTSLPARGFLADHPNAAGFVGGYGDPAANELLAGSDYVLALGASLNEHTTDNGRLVGDAATVVHVDREASHVGGRARADVGVVGGVAPTVDALDAAFAERGLDGDYGTPARIDDARERGEVDDRPFEPVEGYADPRVVLRELDDVLPAARHVVTDAGHFTEWVTENLSIPAGGAFVWPMEFGTIGLAQPVALGVAHGDDDRLPVAICGDAGFQMSIGELNTAVRMDRPFLVVVMNDDALGAEFHRMRTASGSAEPARVPSPDFAAIAEGYGASGLTVRSPDDVAANAERIADPDGVLVLDCKIDQRLPTRTFDPAHDSTFDH
ncbi:MAG: thiamine pyrophosphate-binding protein [Halarchaeum sp.]